MIEKIWKKLANPESVSYVFFGVLTTLVDWGSYRLFRVVGTDYRMATALSWAAAVLFAYVTNRRWVFESKVRGAKGIAVEMTKFFGARGVSLVMDLLCMYLGVDLLSLNDKAVKVVSSVIVVIANYIFSKLFVFRSSTGQDQKRESR